MVDVSKIQVGDEVAIRVTVSRAPTEGWVTATSFVSDQWNVQVERIVTHTPKPREIKVGDTVSWGAKYQKFKVIAVHNGEAWLENYGLRALERLEHVDA